MYLCSTISSQGYYTPKCFHFQLEKQFHIGSFILVEQSNDGESFQQICAMGGLIKTGGQIYTSSMQHLMPAILPQETTGYVIYFALIGYEGRCPILAVVLDKFLSRKPSQLQDTLWFLFGGRGQKGRPCANQGLPDSDADPTA